MEENNSQPNKYNAALAKYNTNLSDADIQAREKSAGKQHGRR